MKRGKLVLWSLAAAVAVMPTGGASQGAASIPDFSGVWAHPFLTGFEPPQSGPGPVRNRMRRADGVANFQQLVGDYTNPILKPHAAEIVKRHGELSLAGRGYPTPSNQCWPGGVPYVFWDFLMQMFQEPDQITMIYRQGNEVRRVRMNTRHPAVVTPSWYGDSVGRYEGDTLVIDTVGFNDKFWFDRQGTPHTEQLHTTERWTRVNEGTLRNEVTIEDPGAYSRPFVTTWTARLAAPGDEIMENICQENNQFGVAGGHENPFNK
jgi:hypothetical protein